ncbi:hypothetical protein HBH56_064890 [Parastagonospora nodorum]|nr:hypothetical protein HBH56_064890 [Parastagonospora nodorum]KAH3954934.1 hypothetical protein HBH53_011190 [Parastagonospora nodorum]KAH3986514.1 hypothetical protein HBH52_042390 [Parastagonospora nodorum]KAH4040178.1 hypothetical protein HBI09_024710 [Parastagonospora nodorum]KAH4165416.1 hypothetical protein HBH44_065120 [Parastagonospora nodorum]
MAERSHLTINLDYQRLFEALPRCSAAMRSHSICGRARALYHGLSSFYATADRLSVPESQNVSTIKHSSRSGRDFPLPAGVLRVVSGTLRHQLTFYVVIHHS